MTKFLFVPTAHVFLVMFLAAVLISSCVAQGTAPASDAQALQLAAQSLTAMTGGAAINDATISANVTWIAGSDSETGSAVLMAKGTGESRIDLSLTSSFRTDVRNDTFGYPQGASALDGASLQPWALHNCRINASWFLPALSVLAATSDTSLVWSYLGQETVNGVSVQHLRSFRNISNGTPGAIALAQRTSTMDIFLDSASLLPLAFTFNVHPDDDATTDIAVEIDFSGYQAVSGVQVPFHMQKLISGGLALDIAVTSATLNSGLSDSLFAVQ
jgi:hypothetical protein